jgi:phage-related protein
MAKKGRSTRRVSKGKGGKGLFSTIYTPISGALSLVNSVISGTTKGATRITHGAIKGVNRVGKGVTRRLNQGVSAVGKGVSNTVKNVLRKKTRRSRK